MKRLLLVFSIMLTTATMASATDYYIRTDGKDSNKGTSNTSGGAWQNIGIALGKVTTGDCIWMEDGIYKQGSLNGNNLSGLAKGDNTNRVTIKAINKWGAKIESNGEWNALSFFGAKGLTIDGLEIYFPSGVKQGMSCLSIDNSDWITVRNCKMHGAPLGGIAGSSDHYIIENNVVYDCCWRNWDITVNTSGINLYHNQMYSSGPIPGTNFGIIIRNNMVYHCWAEPYANGNAPTDGNGIIIDDWNFTQGGGTKYTKGVLIENNLIFNNGGAGLTVYDSDNATIRNNTFYWNQWKKDMYADSKGSGDIDVTCDRLGLGNNNKIYNNICISNPNQSSFGITIRDQKNFSVENNLVNKIKFSPAFATPSSNIISSEIQFVNPSTDPAVADFHLLNTSKATDAGNNAFASIVDFDGNARLYGTTVDIGAYEYFSKQTGSIIGTDGSRKGNSTDDKTSAFDGNTATFFDCTTTDFAWTGMDLGTAKVITSIRFFPRANSQSLMVNGVFEGSNTADFSSGVEKLFTITSEPTDAWTTLKISSQTAFRYVRYLSPVGSSGNIAEIEFSGRSAHSGMPGEIIGTDGSLSTTSLDDKTTVFDGDTVTFFNSKTADNAWAGLDLGAAAVIGNIRYFPRLDESGRMVGGVFEGSNTSDFSAGTEMLHTITSLPVNGWNSVSISNATKFRYVRFKAPDGGFGNVAELEFYAAAPDLQSPTVPKGLISSNLKDNSITLSWEASTDAAGVAGYEIYKDGISIGTTVSNTFNVSGLSPAFQYSFTVSAFDTNSNWSAQSSALLVTTSSVDGISKLAGTVMGTDGTWSNGSADDKTTAFDGKTTTFFDSRTADFAWTGLDFGSKKVITNIRYYTRYNFTGRMTNGVFEGSNSATFDEGVVILATIKTEPTNTTWMTIPVTNKTAFRYIRYKAPVGGYGNVAEIEFYGKSLPTAVVEARTENKLEIYPNPAENECRIKLTNPGTQDSDVTLNIYNVQGKLINSTIHKSHSGSQEISLNTSAYQSGIYLVDCLWKDGARKTEKLIIK